jgi:hypothetical protein
VAGLKICTDGDAHYDEEIGGWSWQSYPLTHMAGFSREVALTKVSARAGASVTGSGRVTPASRSRPRRSRQLAPRLMLRLVMLAPRARIFLRRIRSGTNFLTLSVKYLTGFNRLLTDAPTWADGPVHQLGGSHGT